MNAFDFHQEKLLSDPKYAEQRETFKRVAAIKKGFTDNGPPKSLTLSQRMSANKRSKVASSGHLDAEHMKNLASL